MNSMSDFISQREQDNEKCQRTTSGLAQAGV